MPDGQINSKEYECGRCIYFFPSEHEPGEFGFCRRYAPRPLITGIGDGAEEWEAFQYAKWPSVHFDNWCGEFESI
jgi:hypothetical protein